MIDVCALPPKVDIHRPDGNLRFADVERYVIPLRLTSGEHPHCRGELAYVGRGERKAVEEGTALRVGGIGIIDRKHDAVDAKR
jgi:hypothetical protein